MMDGLIFCLGLLEMAILKITGRKSYSELLENLEKRNMSMNFLLPIGLFLIDKLNLKFDSSYSRKLYYHCVEIVGFQKSVWMLKATFAKKINYAMIGMWIVLFLIQNVSLLSVTSLFVLSIPFAIFFIPDFELKELAKKRRMQLRLQFPLFLNKILLLIHSGMTIQAAWKRIARESNPNSLLDFEVKSSALRLESAEDEIKVYEDFARSCRLPEVSKFVAVLTMNVKKGGEDIFMLLRLQSAECWEIRKRATLKLGEEASSKMVLPLILNFISIIIAVVTPAVISFLSK